MGELLSRCRKVSTVQIPVVSIVLDSSMAYAKGVHGGSVVPAALPPAPGIQRESAVALLLVRMGLIGSASGTAVERSL